ncbi:MAG: succinate dehydrogenase, hydrophobic membrane anchor protein [Alphaproteobacteria bacterium]|nr:succinate dehydrogenase, hydrophobic membrane anchor protein [Alphaproteobacteria bacterium]
MSDKKDLRSPLAKVRGLGSAKSGTHHWLAQRMTALALIPLVLYVLIGFLNNVVAGGYSGAHYWLGSPLPATFTIMFLLAGLYHGALGLQVVIEDYIHCSCVKMGLVFATYFAAVALAILGTLSVAKIFFGV